MYQKDGDLYTFPMDRDQLKGCISITDVYKKLGILDLFRSLGIKGDVQFIRMSKRTMDKVYSRLQENIGKSRDRRVAAYKKEYRVSHMLAWDWACYAPMEDGSARDWVAIVDLRKKDGKDKKNDPE